MVKGGYINPVWVCETDILSPAIIQVAVSVGIVHLTSERYTDGFSYTEEELCKVLEQFFGFDGGIYTFEVLPFQKTKLGNEVVENKKRYFGTERSDKDWVNLKMVESGICSREMYEMVTYGEIISV